MILKKYFPFAIIICLALGKVKSETINLATDQDQETTQDNVEATTEGVSVSVTLEPVIEMDEQNPGNDQEPMKVMALNLNDEDKVMLQNLNGIIEKLPEEDTQQEEETRKQNSRQSKAIKDEHFKAAAEALTDDEITEIIKSIAFPNEDELKEDSEALKLASDSEVEPRTGRALRTHGYYVIAFTPIQEEETVEGEQQKLNKLPYTRLHILPAERSVDGDAFENPRFISKRSWNKYIRRIMRQIRKGTRKVQRKTKVKSLKDEPTTVENFLKRMYTIAQGKNIKQQQDTKKKTSWLVW